MSRTQVARAAAQLHEAALDVARVAALRGAGLKETAGHPQVFQQPGLAGDSDDVILSAPGASGSDGGESSIVGLAVKAVTRAMPLPCPAEAGGAGHG
jgi:hypothetical protein